LLTEAEFEFAARAGTATAFPWGDDLVAGKANCGGGGNQLGSGPSPVVQFSPNAYGLFDMHGNVGQGVDDCCFDSHAGTPLDGKARPANEGERHFVRRPGWDSGHEAIRSAARSFGTLPRRDFNIGFRVARTLG